MNREEMLKKLHEVSFCAVATVATMDMGLQFDYINSEGAGTGLGAFGGWPAFILRQIEYSQWKIIREKVASDTLCIDDLIGTDLENLANAIKGFHQDQFDNLSCTFANLTMLPDKLTDSFYCRYDLRAWDDTPDFFEKEIDFLEEFDSIYCGELQIWDDMGDDELKEWLERIEGDEGDLKVFQYISYAEDDETA
mgnify:CR=1 FL=1